MINDITKYKKYNIHCLLYDMLHIGKHHFKSKFLCKCGWHNYQLKGLVEVVPEIEKEFDPTGRYVISKLVKYNKIWTTYCECYCCKKKIGMEKGND